LLHHASQLVGERAELIIMGRFDPLSDLDFEELAADLLRADTRLPFRAGVRGRDRGIDVLAVENRRRHVGQCKHVRTGNIRGVVREAGREAEKLAKRKPTWASYRFITSMRLSHDRRDQIADVLSPWIASPSTSSGRATSTGSCDSTQKSRRATSSSGLAAPARYAGRCTLAHMSGARRCSKRPVWLCRGTSRPTPS
jgi:hypothetical protein